MLSAEFIPAAIVKEQGKVNKTEPTKESLQEIESVSKEIIKETKQQDEISKHFDAKTPVKNIKTTKIIRCWKDSHRLYLKLKYRKERDVWNS